MLGMPCMPKPIPAMTILSLGAGLPARPSAEARTIVGKPAAPAAAREAVLRNSRLFMPRLA